MRNPLASWDKSDSYYDIDALNVPSDNYIIGENDKKLALNLCKAGSDHRKFLRQILVSVDITAPWYWWKQYHTHKIATVENSTSTMHCITKRELTEDDFEWDYMNNYRYHILYHLNHLIRMYKKYNDKKYWRELIQDIPGSFIYTKTCTLNYEVLRNMYHSRKSHKLSEWHEFCDWITKLPYSELITSD